MYCIAPRKHKTMSAFAIGETTNNKLYSSPAVLNSSPRSPQLCIFCMSLFVNTPDSDNQLVRSELRALTVFPLTWSLHSVHCSLLPEQGKSVEVYLSLEHLFRDLCCATSSHTSVTSYTSVNKYNFN